VKEQVRIRKKQLRDKTLRLKDAESGKVAEIWQPSFRLSKEEFVASMLAKASHEVDYATKLVSKWEARLAALVQLIDAAKLR
jgi:hypothetical protein